MLCLYSRKQHPEGKYSKIAAGAAMTQTSNKHHVLHFKVSLALQQSQTDNQMGSSSYLASVVGSHQIIPFSRRCSLFRLRSYLRLESDILNLWAEVRMSEYTQQCCLQTGHQEPGFVKLLDPGCLSQTYISSQQICTSFSGATLFTD